MDPDPEAEQAASKMLQATFITVVFTACHSFQTETSTAVSTIQLTLPDSIIKEKLAPVSKKKKKKTIYLTFDDGPNKGTRKVMHIAEAEQVPVTMFIIGEHVYGSAEQTATYDSIEQSKYIELNNHSYTHAGGRYDKFYCRPDSVIMDFRRCADSLGLSTNIIRTPGRNIWRTTLISCTDIKKTTAAADSLFRSGFSLVGWDLEWHYDKLMNLKSTDDEMLQQVDSAFAKGHTKTPDHLVLLAHDQAYADAADSISLLGFIKKLKGADDFNFEVISKYPGLKN